MNATQILGQVLIALSSFLLGGVLRGQSLAIKSRVPMGVAVGLSGLGYGCWLLAY